MSNEPNIYQKDLKGYGKRHILKLRDEGWYKSSMVMQELLNKVEELEDEIVLLKDPIYCPICGSCGTEGCCSEEICLYNDEKLIAELKVARKVIGFYANEDNWEWLVGKTATIMHDMAKDSGQKVRDYLEKQKDKK